MPFRGRAPKAPSSRSASRSCISETHLISEASSEATGLHKNAGSLTLGQPRLAVVPQLREGHKDSYSPRHLVKFSFIILESRSVTQSYPSWRLTLRKRTPRPTISNAAPRKKPTMLALAVSVWRNRGRSSVALIDDWCSPSDSCIASA